MNNAFEKPITNPDEIPQETLDNLRNNKGKEEQICQTLH